MILNENGLRLPPNTKSAKIITHEDMDGFMSALLLYNQLVKQGIPGDRIDIKFTNYGDYKQLDKATRKNKYQALLSCDFSGFPKVDMERCYNSMSRSFDASKDKYNYDKNTTYQDFKKAHINDQPSFAILSNWMKEHHPNSMFITRPKDSSVRYSYDDFMKGWKNYKGSDDVIITDFDYTSDHHSNVKGNLVPGKAGSIGREEFKSDTEHLATVAAQNLMNWEDIAVVSRIDSATYKNLQDVIDMPTKLTGKDGKERLGILVSALVTTLIKSNPRLAMQLIKQSQPSLVSVYNNALKVAHLNDNELEIMKLLKEKDVNWDRVNELLKTLPKSEQRNVLQRRDEEHIKPTSSIEQMKAKNEKALERDTIADKSDFKFYGNTSVWKSSNTKLQANRYLFAFLQHNGKSPVFNIRQYPSLGMIQVSASPFIKESDKAKIDLEPIGNAALDSAHDNGLISDFAYNAIKKKSGGHKLIYNISGMDIMQKTELSPLERKESKYLKDFEERRKKLDKVLGKEVKKALDTKKDRIEALKQKQSGPESSFGKATDYIIKYIVRELNDKFKDIEVQPSRTYEVK